MKSVLHPWQMLLLILAGRVNQQQQNAIEDLIAENRILRDKIGKNGFCLLMTSVGDWQLRASIVSVLETVARRTPAWINSFRYFVREIIAQPDPGNRAYQKSRLEKIVRRIHDNSVGCSEYSMADFVEDVKCYCAREGILFDNDIFNELAS